MVRQSKVDALVAATATHVSDSEQLQKLLTSQVSAGASVTSCGTTTAAKRTRVEAAQKELDDAIAAEDAAKTEKARIDVQVTEATAAMGSRGQPTAVQSLRARVDTAFNGIPPETLAELGIDNAKLSEGFGFILLLENTLNHLAAVAAASAAPAAAIGPTLVVGTTPAPAFNTAAATTAASSAAPMDLTGAATPGADTGAGDAFASGDSRLG